MFQQAIEILLSLPAVFLAISFHEYAHAFTADKLGDDTPRRQGRLTLAPLAHVDWIGLILFALFGYGWAKPVQVNPSNFKNKKTGDILVSLSGPAANFLVAIICLLLYVALIAVNSSAAAMDTILAVVDYCIYLNIVFALLNLIPIPPLDGYHVIKTLLFRSWTRFFIAYEKLGIFILFAFLLFGLFDFAVSRPALTIYSFLMTTGQSILTLLQ
ncbi:MAG TPA: site-2 protease family protein [Clostridiales bacterium]|nr:site-2 protease family protein [Clostridia bacterium]HCS75692.1 site-2 protease family protein [Clostridiales bacterium]